MIWDKTKISIVSIIFVIIFSIIIFKPYETENIELNDSDKYLNEEYDINWNEDLVYIAKMINQSSNTERDKVKSTLEFVYKNIKYDAKVSVAECYSESSVSVFEKGSGDCVSMSRLTTSLLRLQNIPARTVGGCVSSLNPCTPLFSLIPPPSLQAVSMEAGDNKKRGFLHEWVEAYVDGEWILLETTANRILEKNCNQYIIYDYDSNQYDRCVINDNNFWQTCRVA